MFILLVFKNATLICYLIWWKIRHTTFLKNKQIYATIYFHVWILSGQYLVSIKFTFCLSTIRIVRNIKLLTKLNNCDWYYDFWLAFRKQHNTVKFCKYLFYIMYLIILFIHHIALCMFNFVFLYFIYLCIIYLNVLFTRYRQCYFSIINIQ